MGIWLRQALVIIDRARSQARVIGVPMNKLFSAPSGVDYAHRDVGEGDAPLILLQHFCGNLGDWDPGLVLDQVASSTFGTREGR